MPRSAHARIGLVGTGFIGRGLAAVLLEHDDLALGPVLTRGDPAARDDLPAPDRLTRSVDELIRGSDLVVECSGSVPHGTEVLDAVLGAGVPAVTMDAELQVTTGSWLQRRHAGSALLTEAEGDQPGSLAALDERVRAMGFVPLVYGNVKGFLDPDPSAESMRVWAERQGISVAATTAFTDGTKVQVEAALVANGLGAGIARTGLVGASAAGIEDGARALAAEAERVGGPISDFVLSPGAPPGVFVVARHRDPHRAALRYLKLGNGPHYTLVRNEHLIHLEIPLTIRRVLDGGGALLTNGERPRIGVGAVAKRRLRPGERIARGIGGDAVRGLALEIGKQPEHAPIGLLDGATVERAVEPGTLLSSDDVALPDTLATRAWREVLKHAVTRVA